MAESAWGYSGIVKIGRAVALKLLCKIRLVSSEQIA